MASAAKRTLLTVAACAAFVYALVYADLVLRARAGYLEGERYMAWHRDPAAKAAHFDAQLARELAELEREKASGKLAGAELRQAAELARFRRDEAVAESALKYAYHWHKTVVELFSPPESRWVRRSRARMAEALSLWKRELDEKKIPYEDYMLE